MLTPLEIERYERQLILAGWSADKQVALKRFTALLPTHLPSAALYLAAAGIGRIVFYGEQNSGQISPLCSHLMKLNDEVVIDTLEDGSSQLALGEETVIVEVARDGVSPQNLVSELSAHRIELNFQPSVLQMTIDHTQTVNLPNEAKASPLLGAIISLAVLNLVRRA